MSRQAGISLVEMLVVLAIVGVMSSVTMLSVGAATRGGSPETEAQRLASHLRLAIDDALVTDRDLVLAWDETGYAFHHQVRSGAWEPVSASALGLRHDLPSRLHLEADTKGDPIWIGSDGDGPSATLVIDDGDRPWRVRLDGFTAIAAPGRAPEQ